MSKGIVKKIKKLFGIKTEISRSILYNCRFPGIIERGEDGTISIESLKEYNKYIYIKFRDNKYFNRFSDKEKVKVSLQLSRNKYQSLDSPVFYIATKLKASGYITDNRKFKHTVNFHDVHILEMKGIIKKYYL